ncbi:MAG TPA: hypothetical protein DEV81_20505, partial [Cyanobacteria bacterium UBA11049]|nr:hypothetical protein [Cyanobacteria bacterium UBA11049]
MKSSGSGAESLGKALPMGTKFTRRLHCMRKIGNRSWLDIAEYASLAGSVAGSIVAVASQQVVYAAAPLTLAMSLSLVNRQRLQQQSQQQTNAIANMCQEVRSVHDKIQVLPPQERVNDVEGSIRKLEQTIVD